MTGGQIKRGGMFRLRSIIESAIHPQSQSALGQAGLLIGRDHMLRLTSAPTLEPIALDGVARASSERPQQAKRIV